MFRDDGFIFPYRFLGMIDHRTWRTTFGSWTPEIDYELLEWFNLIFFFFFFFNGLRIKLIKIIYIISERKNDVINESSDIIFEIEIDF